MRIHLFNNGTAVISGLNPKTLVADKPGTLRIGCSSFAVLDLKETVIPRMTDGCYTASFISEDGKEYRVGYISVHNGGIVAARTSENELLLHHELDRANEKIEELTAKVAELEKIFDTDSLNFLLSKK